MNQVILRQARWNRERSFNYLDQGVYRWPLLHTN